jgi:hypothetical protein
LAAWISTDPARISTEEFKAEWASRVVAYPPPSGISRICSRTSAFKSPAEADKLPADRAADKIERVRSFIIVRKIESLLVPMS